MSTYMADLKSNDGYSSLKTIHNSSDFPLLGSSSGKEPEINEDAVTVEELNVPSSLVDEQMKKVEGLEKELSIKEEKEKELSNILTVHTAKVRTAIKNTEMRLFHNLSSPAHE